MKLPRLLLPTERFTSHDRAVALTMWLVGVVQGFSQAHPSAGLPATRAGLGISEADMSALLAVARLASLGAVVLSVWGDRRGRRPPLLVAYGLVVLATGASAAVSSPWQFGVSQSLVRVAVTALSSLGVVWLAEHLAPHVRAYGVAVYGAAGSLGAGLALMALPLAERDWRLPYLVSLLGLALIPVLARRFEESPLVEPAHARDGVFAELRAAARERWFGVAAAAGLLPSAFMALGLAFTTERLVGDLGLSTGVAVLIALGGGTLGGAGFFLGGRLADAWGRRPTTILALSAILVGGIGLYHLRSVMWLVVAVMVSSFGSFAYGPSAATHRAELFPTASRATAAATLTWVGTVGSALGLASGRLLIDRVGLTGTMDRLGLGVLVAILLTTLLPETRGKRLVPSSG